MDVRTLAMLPDQSDARERLTLAPLPHAGDGERPPGWHGPAGKPDPCEARMRCLTVSSDSGHKHARWKN
jgi:hypothetical protein